jgi:hypothetical protein
LPARGIDGFEFDRRARRNMQNGSDRIVPPPMMLVAVYRVLVCQGAPQCQMSVLAS